MELWFMVSPGEDFQTFNIFSDPDAQPDMKSNRPALEVFVDRFVVVLHDENSETDAPGPIASQPWLEGWLKVITEFADPDQWIGAARRLRLRLEHHDEKDGDDHLQGRDEPRELRRRRSAGDKVDVGRAELQRRSTTTPSRTASTPSAFSTPSRSTISCAPCAAAKFGGVGISRLGTEDPQIWDVLELKGTAHRRDAQGARHAQGQRHDHATSAAAKS